MTEVIFHGQKQFSYLPPLSGNINVDITLVEHLSTKKIQYIEIICMNLDKRKESKRIYLQMKIICDIIENEEVEKNEKNGGIKSKSTESVPLSNAAMRSIMIQKILDLLQLNSNINSNLIIDTNLNQNINTNQNQNQNQNTNNSNAIINGNGQGSTEDNFSMILLPLKDIILSLLYTPDDIQQYKVIQR